MATGILNVCLYPEVKLKIVQYFIRNPDLRQNQTQLARSIKTPQNTVSRYIPDLVKLRVLDEERHGKSAVYSLNKASLIANRLLKEIVSAEQRLLPEWIKGQMNQLSSKARSSVEEVVLFGSAARGEFRVTSDIDLLVIVSKKSPDLEFELNSVLVAAGNEVGLKVNLQIETQAKYDSAMGRRYLKNVKTEGIPIWERKQNASR
ncbi:nucleotidyltransferase domain-containing protein [Bdellovibrionota bacterium FG-1]